MRPLYDALFEMLGPENYARHIEKNTIEIGAFGIAQGIAHSTGSTGSTGDVCIAQGR